MATLATTRRTPLLWFAAMAGVIAATQGLGWLLIAQGRSAGGQTIHVTGYVAALVLLTVMLVRLREVAFVRRLGGYALTTAGVLVLVLIAMSMGWSGLVTALLGALAMSATFVVGLALIRFVLSPGFAITGVARTLVDEAIRMRVALVFLVAVILLVPILPLILDAQEKLQYRIQSFLSMSLMSISALLGMMTVFVAVRTVTGEIQEKQIFLTMTKPVARWQYLVGKWLGLALLNGLLVAVAILGVYVFTILLAQQRASDPLDRLAVDEQVLVARSSSRAQPDDPQMFGRLLAERLERARADATVEDSERFGPPGTSVDTARPEARQQLMNQVIDQWHAIGPRQTQVYRFTGLDRVPTQTRSVQLRMKPKASGRVESGFINLGIRLNGRVFTHPTLTDPRTLTIRLSNDTYHVLDLPVAAINDQGVLDVAITNVALGGQQQPTISFNRKDGLEVLYRVGSFEGNLFRGGLLVWARLLFLGMLGIAAGTFLGFPIACLLCFMIYFATAMSGYMVDAVANYALKPPGDLTAWEKIVWVPLAVWQQAVVEGNVWAAIKIIVRLIGLGFMTVTPSLGEYSPTGRLTEGRFISPREVTTAVGAVAGLWSLVAGLIGYAIFRAREIARVTV